MRIDGKEKKNERVDAKALSDEQYTALGRACAYVVSRGAGLSLFGTRNGTAIGFRLMWGTLNEAEYHKDWAELVGAVEDVARQMEETEAPESPPPKKGTKIRLEA